MTLTFVPEDTTSPEESTSREFLLQTTDVEIFNDKKHPVYWDWIPGNAFPDPIGFIDDTELVVGRPEFHKLSVPSDVSSQGTHTITIVVNPEVSAGLKDDFVLEKILASNSIGVKIGW